MYVCIQILVGARTVRVLVLTSCGCKYGYGYRYKYMWGYLGLIFPEDCSTVLQGDVSVSRFVVVSCSFFFAMVVCEVII